VRNIGTVPTRYSKLWIALSDDQVFDPGDRILARMYVTYMAPQSVRTKAFTAALPANANGKYLIAVCDPGGVIAELDETNNFATTQAVLP
jgi:hypothetical protein